LKFNEEKLKRAGKKRNKGDNTKCSNDGMKQYKHSSMDKMFCLFYHRKDDIFMNLEHWMQMRL